MKCSHSVAYDWNKCIAFICAYLDFLKISFHGDRKYWIYAQCTSAFICTVNYFPGALFWKRNNCIIQKPVVQIGFATAHSSEVFI